MKNYVKGEYGWCDQIFIVVDLIFGFYFLLYDVICYLICSII